MAWWEDPSRTAARGQRDGTRGLWRLLATWGMGLVAVWACFEEKILESITGYCSRIALGEFCLKENGTILDFAVTPSPFSENENDQLRDTPFQWQRQRFIKNQKLLDESSHWFFQIYSIMRKQEVFSSLKLEICIFRSNVAQRCESEEFCCQCFIASISDLSE